MIAYVCFWYISDCLLLFYGLENIVYSKVKNMRLLSNVSEILWSKTLFRLEIAKNMKTRAQVKYRYMNTSHLQDSWSVQLLSPQGFQPGSFSVDNNC